MRLRKTKKTLKIFSEIVDWNSRSFWQKLSLGDLQRCHKQIWSVKNMSPVALPMTNRYYVQEVIKQHQDSLTVEFRNEPLPLPTNSQVLKWPQTISKKISLPPKIFIFCNPPKISKLKIWNCKNLPSLHYIKNIRVIPLTFSIWPIWTFPIEPIHYEYLFKCLKYGRMQWFYLAIFTTLYGRHSQS